MAAFRTLWTALVGLYEETLVLLGGNVATVALNLPLILVVRFLALPLVSVDDPSNASLFVSIVAFTMVIPTPGNVGLAGLTRVAAGPDVPRFAAFQASLKQRWRLAAACTLVSTGVLVAIMWYVTASVTLGWPLLIAIFWLYVGLFWLSLHLYIVPLAVHVEEPRLLDLYRRAALISLGHPGYTFILLILLLIISFASVVFLPVYVLVAQSFVSLAQTHALREIRRRHGDLLAEAEEEVSRL